MSTVPVSGPDWVRDAVFYQVFPDRFAMSARVRKPVHLEPWDAAPTSHGFKGGDLLGIAEHLDELADLGITALYLTPVFTSASNHRYHAYEYEHVDPLLGGDDALRELLDLAHRRDMRVILDGVFNHVGRGFWQFHHILENGGQSPYRDWFHVDPGVLAGRRGLDAYPDERTVDQMRRLETPQDRSTPSERVIGYQAWWDHPALPKLNHANPDVRAHIFEIAEKWLRFGIDGWRLDVPQEIGEAGFWEEFRSRCLAVNAEAYLVGEIWYPAPEWLAGDRFHGLMNYPLTEAVLSFTGGRGLDLELVAKAEELGRHVHAVDGPEFGRWLSAVMTTYAPDVTAHQLNLLDSHDTPRFVSMAGNSGAALRLATLVQMTLPGAPCIYYGDEVGLQGGHDPDCRRAYPWDPARQDRSLREFVRGLVAIRKSEPLFRHGRFELLAAEGKAVAYRLAGEAGGGAGRSVVVALNAGYEPVRLRVGVPGWDGFAATPIIWPGSEWQPAVAAGRVQEGSIELDLAPREGSIVELSTEA
jgi:cyclomaltodextrinase / maltogenic alpha-amylase / neopullulanase